MPGQPVALPRMTRRDKWLDPPRPVVARYRMFKTNIIAAWNTAGSPRFTRLELSCRFFLFGNYEVDLDNLVKGVCDALQPWVIQKDSIDYIPRYGIMEASRVKKYQEARTEIGLVAI